MTQTLNTRHLGLTGLTVSEIALGTWRFGHENDSGSIRVDEQRAHELLTAYHGYGGNFIDTANVYGGGRSERYIGNWLDGQDRDDFVIASKIYWPTDDDNPHSGGLNRRTLRRQLHRILDRLGVDYLDILYTHRWDEITDVGVVMRTLNQFVEAGKVDYLGFSTSVPNAWRVVRANEFAERHGLEPFTVTQPQYNLVTRQIEQNFIPMCRKYDLPIVPWSPLAGGFLTGKYERDETISRDTRAAHDDYFEDRYLTDRNFEILGEVRKTSEETGMSPVQVSLAWLLRHEDVTVPIIGARTRDQLDENVEAAGRSLSDEHHDTLSSSGSSGGY